MELSAGEHFVDGDLVLDASLTLSRLEIIAASGANISSTSSILLEVRAGSPPVKLQGLQLDGQVIIEGGTVEAPVEIADCRFVSGESRRRRLQASTEARALLISDGYVSISEAVFEGLQGGAIEVNGGTLAVHNSTFESNQAESGGALLVTGGDVRVQNSTFKDNKITDRSSGSGGAIRVSGTNTKLELGELTTITGSSRTGYGGSVASDVEWTYTLPAPLAHYVSNPQGDGVARNGAGTYDYDYPNPCSATLYGNSYEVIHQAAPSCEDSCPEGNYCGTKTVDPIPCQAGTYCPRESASETPCPAGTYNEYQLETSPEACLDCGPGTFCPERSKGPTNCSTGTYGNASRQGACIKCAKGTFQNLTGQMACKICESGSYCQMQSASQGASTATLCRAGSYSSLTNLSEVDGCDDCPPGSYCEAGATKPTPCPEGKESTRFRSTSETLCTTCKDDTTSLPGELCNYCKEDFFFDQRETKCRPCLKLGDGANCSETTPNGVDILTHGPTSLTSVRIRPNYWRLGENSTSLSQCLETADGSGPCVGGNRSGDENEYKLGYTGNGYCKAGHTGPLCQVCSTSGFYFDGDETMDCIQCPSPSDRLYLPIGCLCLLAVLVLAAIGIKKYAPLILPPPASLHHASRLLPISFFQWSARTSRNFGEQLREFLSKVQRMVARIKELDIKPRCKLLFS